MQVLNDYFERRFTADLNYYFVIKPVNGYRFAEGVNHRLYPVAETTVENKELFAALAFNMLVVQFAIRERGCEEMLEDFLRASRWPMFMPAEENIYDPYGFLERAELPVPGEKAMMDAACYIRKELELTLESGKWRSHIYSQRAYSVSEKKIMAIPMRQKEEIFQRFDELCKKFNMIRGYVASEREPLTCHAVNGSILRGERFGLDGVVIFQRRGFNGLYAKSKQYVEQLPFVKETGDIRIYMGQGLLKNVLVYTYSQHHDAHQAAKVFRAVIKVADQLGIKHLGMNGLELTADAIARDGEGRAMMDLVKDAAKETGPSSLKELWFIDPNGAFEKL